MRLIAEFYAAGAAAMMTVSFSNGISGKHDGIELAKDPRHRERVSGSLERRPHTVMSQCGTGTSRTRIWDISPVCSQLSKKEP